MNTGTNNTEARAVAETAQPVQQFNFNEADIAAFVKAKADEYAPYFPELKELNGTMGLRGEVSFFGYDSEWQSVTAYGATFADCAASLRAKLGTPASKAAALRVEAMKLLARADELAPVG